MSKELIVYLQDVVCDDSVSGTKVTHYNRWNTSIYNTCPTENPDHTWYISLKKMEFSNINVIPKNNSENTYGKNRLRQFKYDIPAGPMASKQQIAQFNLDYNSRVSTIIIPGMPYNVGDSFSVYISPATALGLTTVAVSSGTTIVVNSTVMAFTTNGAEVILDDGVNVQNLGECISVNTNTSSITVQEAVAHSFAVGTQVYIRFAILKDAEFVRADDIIEHGFGIDGNMLIRPDKTITIEYKNLTNVAKVINFRVTMFI